MERNEKVHCIKLKNKKLHCDCGEDIYVGIPCRHLLTVLTKEKSLDFYALIFNERWKINFFHETVTAQDLINLKKSRDDLEEEKSEEVPEEIPGEGEVSFRMMIIYLNQLDTKSKNN